MEKVLLDVESAAQALSLGRTVVYRLIASGELASIKVGKRRLIPVEAVRRFGERRLVEAQE